MTNTMPPSFDFFTHKVSTSTQFEEITGLVLTTQREYLTVTHCEGDTLPLGGKSQKPCAGSF